MRPTGSRRFTATVSGPLWIENGLTTPTWCLEGDEWVEGPSPGDAAGSTYPHIAAVPEGVATLDDRGALHLTTPDHVVTRLAPPWGGLNDLDDNDLVTMVHDSYAGPLVLWHGRRSRTWTGRGPGWRQVTGNHPPAGPAVLCATPAGVYCQCGDELWLLDHDDAWALAGSAAGHASLLLACSEAIPALWSVSAGGVAVWQDGAFQHVMDLPGPVALDKAGPDRVPPFSPPSKVAYDPAMQRLLILGPSGAWELALTDLAGYAPALPAPDTSTADSGTAPAQEAEPERSASARSCYILEISCGPGATPLGELFVYPELDHIRACLDQTVLSDEEPAGRMYREVLTDATLHLWVVQEGILAQGTDLRPFLRGPDQAAPGPDFRGWLITLLEGFEPADDEGLDDAHVVSFTDQPVAAHAPGWLTIDWPAVAAISPALRGRRVGPGGVRVRVDGAHPDPDVDTYLEHGEFLFHGFTDLSGGGDEPMAQEFTDPDDHSTWDDPDDDDEHDLDDPEYDD